MILKLIQCARSTYRLYPWVNYQRQQEFGELIRVIETWAGQVVGTDICSSLTLRSNPRYTLNHGLSDAIADTTLATRWKLIAREWRQLPSCNKSLLKSNQLITTNPVGTVGSSDRYPCWFVEPLKSSLAKSCMNFLMATS